MSCQRSIILQVPGLRPSLADPLRVGNWFSTCPVCSVGTRPQQFLASSSSAHMSKKRWKKKQSGRRKLMTKDKQDIRCKQHLFDKEEDTEMIGRTPHPWYQPEKQTKTPYQTRHQCRVVVMNQ
ncbi:hypothetical protein D6D04_03300 [Aureobasidium pullulans]|nr:hypothetical protein D6D04_03300 [Aureobasidium pullulans]